MLLDYTGQAIRRPCGFNREYERAHEPKADIDVSACGFSIQCEEYAPAEECDLSAAAASTTSLETLSDREQPASKKRRRENAQ